MHRSQRLVLIFQQFLYPWQQHNNSARRCQLLFFGGGSGGGGGRGPGGGPLWQSYLEVHFRIGDAKAVYSSRQAVVNNV
jgi:hypothetical protein